MQQQHSIFEPLFSSFQLAPTMELMRMERQAPTPAEKAFLSSSHYDAPSHSWFTETPPPSTTNCIGIRRATCSSLPFLHPHAPIAVSSHLPIHIPKLSSPSRIHEQQSSSLDISLPRAHDDDGSVASKLLSSITKSISSPSLNLPTSKEVARETPYQKSLKLKHLKLQHCAEALGMESSDSSSSSAAGYNIICPSIEQKKLDMIENLSSWPSSVPPKISNQEYSLTSVKSAPNLSAPPIMMTSQRSKYMRCASFPPPLSHTLPASPSACDSLLLSLRSYRQDGRLILKEVVVPSKNYFHANRSNGRLILRVLTRDPDDDEEESARQYHEQQGLISSDSCGFADAIAEEEIMELKESMISLDQTTLLEVGISDGNEIVCTNKTHPLVEEASAKASVHSIELFMSDATELPNIAAKVTTMKRVCIAGHGDDQTLAKTSAASAANLLNLRRMQCIHVEPRGGQLHHLGDPATRRVKSNILSNVIALTLQTSNHSPKLSTLQKAQVVNSLQPSRYPLSSTRSMEQSTVIQTPGYERSLLASSHHDMSTLPESKENFIWESYLLPCVEVCSRKSMRRDDNIESSFVLEELNVNSLIKMVAPGLATVGVTCDVGDWYTLANRRKPSREDNNETKVTDAMLFDLDASTIAADALSSATMGEEISGKALEHNIANHGSGIDPHRGFNHHDHDEEKVSIDGINEAGEEVAISSTLYSTTSALPPPPTYNLQSDEWLHTLHCKELSDIRNQFGICNFMQPHSNCIATRS